MKTKLIWGLALFNSALAFMLVWRLVPSNTAYAQAGGGQRVGECLLIPAEISGTADAVVYVVDTSNGTLGAMYFDATTSRMQHMPAIDLQRVFGAAMNGGSGIGANPGMAVPNTAVPPKVPPRK